MSRGPRVPGPAPEFQTKNISLATPSKFDLILYSYSVSTPVDVDCVCVCGYSIHVTQYVPKPESENTQRVPALFLLAYYRVTVNVISL